MKRVLIINISDTTYNGVTSVIMNYVRPTHNTVKYDFVLCKIVDKRFVDELNELGENTYIPPCSRERHPVKYYRWLKNLMKRNKYDCVHVHGNSGTVYVEIHAAKKAGVPVRIAHSHSTSCKYLLVHKLLKSLLNKELTHAIACSDLAGKWLFDREHTILPNGIEVDRFKYSEDLRTRYRKELSLEDKFVIGHVGYMEDVKNHAYLLRVFEKLIQRKENAHLLLIGDGKIRAQIESSIFENGLSGYVTLLGKRPDIANLYQCMDVFVLPSIYEGLPVTSVEAQAAGLPCLISNNVTKQVSITENVKYINIQESNIDEWADALLNVYECDKQKAFNDVNNSEFNIENSVKILLSTYGC